MNSLKRQGLGGVVGVGAGDTRIVRELGRHCLPPGTNSGNTASRGRGAGLIQERVVLHQSEQNGTGLVSRSEAVRPSE